ncbi:Uncharacterised protein [Vibrio cholerae]|uniref:Uncharacterized protein n=1 Tax=Vibrio cholerae TaxID=666 RepID=A0A655QXZ6_VIBCL|nr:Uncharacterised protein [Vibrio cholerae]CSA59509.1 Uncharacterised protein [Vibrio cholerae]CSA62701.1 Uncharacterised protein [Vibrio cholerae]CSA68610.1 Uncharacterised protein [Vibrio cholerae]CSB93498.1 Uncharacterised protein [Vibrio cholerae]
MFWRCRDNVGHVVADGEIIGAALAQDLLITSLHLNFDAFALPFFAQITGVIATNLYVTEQIFLTHQLLCQQHIFRT